MKLSAEFKSKFYKIAEKHEPEGLYELYEHKTKGEDYPHQLVLNDELKMPTRDDIVTAIKEYRDEMEEP